MAGKRKSKRPTQDREDLSKPTRWRLQHGGFNPQATTPIRTAVLWSRIIVRSIRSA